MQRDRLLALLWPELDESRARGALRQALREGETTRTTTPRVPSAARNIPGALAIMPLFHRYRLTRIR